MTERTHKSDTDVEIRPNALPFDPARYRAELDGFNITEAQKDELLVTLWSIMRSFVELGFSADVCAAVFDEPAAIPTGNDE